MSKTFSLEGVLNLTPHDIVLHHGDDVYTFPASGAVARVEQLPAKVADTFDDIPIWSAPVYGDVIWPDSINEDDDIDAVIVSMVVGNAVQNCNDEGWALGFAVYGPDTSPDSVVRDEKGQIIAVKRLVCYRSGQL